jgi:hypothetical protein
MSVQATCRLETAIGNLKAKHNASAAIISATAPAIPSALYLPPSAPTSISYSGV